jgi:hypothetical protein
LPSRPLREGELSHDTDRGRRRIVVGFCVPVLDPEWDEQP